MPMFGVVPGEEIRAVCARVLDGAEAFRKVGTILERLELRLGVRIVVGDVGTGMCFGNAQIGEQECHRL